MKNLFLFLLSITFLFQSCETSDLESQEQSIQIDFDKIENIKTMDEASQRVAFKLLNHEEKFAFRMLFIDEFIIENDLNSQQLRLIEELKSNYNSKVYLKNDEAEYFKTIFINDWSNRAIDHFSYEELNLIAATHYKKLKNENSVLNRQGNCKCHDGGFFKCTKEVQVTVGLKPEITTINVDCDNPICQVPGSMNDDGHWEEDTGGCGWFWLERCDGTC